MNLEYSFSELLLVNKIYKKKKRNVKRKNALNGREGSVIAYKKKLKYIPFVPQDIKNNNHFY